MCVCNTPNNHQKLFEYGFTKAAHYYRIHIPKKKKFSIYFCPGKNFFLTYEIKTVNFEVTFKLVFDTKQF